LSIRLLPAVRQPYQNNIYQDVATCPIQAKLFIHQFAAVFQVEAVTLLQPGPPPLTLLSDIVAHMPTRALRKMRVMILGMECKSLLRSARRNGSGKESELLVGSLLGGMDGKRERVDSELFFFFSLSNIEYCVFNSIVLS
jgi:hypothetical protein